MAQPTFDFTHALNALKGWPRDWPLDYKAKLSANVTNLPARAGMCAHLNASGQFELGAQLTQMPIFLRNSSTSLDVANDGGTAWTAIAPVGWMSGLVATGAYEFETTEYNTADAASMVPNAILHSPTEGQITGTPKPLAGELCALKSWPGGGGGALTLYTDNVCGVVSGGIRVNSNQVSVLAFWPVYLPGTV